MMPRTAKGDGWPDASMALVRSSSQKLCDGLISAVAITLLAFSINQALAQSATGSPQTQTGDSQATPSTPPVDGKSEKSDDKKKSEAKKLQVVQVTGSLIPQAQIEGASPVTTVRVPAPSPA